MLFAGTTWQVGRGPQIKPEALAGMGDGGVRPWQVALLGALWVAAKLEERRRSLPTASKVPTMQGMQFLRRFTSPSKRPIMLQSHGCVASAPLAPLALAAESLEQ